MKHLLTIILLLALPTLANSQQHPLPPTLQGVQHRSDPITRVYLPPQRVMWTNSDTLVTNTSTLLGIKDGQTELGTSNMCAMHTNATDTASILLDYGRELHGGIKLVFGSSSSQAPSWVRIRFGESGTIAAPDTSLACFSNTLPSLIVIAPRNALSVPVFVVPSAKMNVYVVSPFAFHSSVSTESSSAAKYPAPPFSKTA